MTPQEKANDLVEKFMPYAESEYADSTALMRGVHKENAKQCAIICVNKELETLELLHSHLNHNAYSSNVIGEIIMEKTKVLTEIEKL